MKLFCKNITVEKIHWKYKNLLSESSTAKHDKLKAKNRNSLLSK